MAWIPIFIWQFVWLWTSVVTSALLLCKPYFLEDFSDSERKSVSSVWPGRKPWVCVIIDVILKREVNVFSLLLLQERMCQTRQETSLNLSRFITRMRKLQKWVTTAENFTNYNYEENLHYHWPVAGEGGGCRGAGRGPLWVQVFFIFLYILEIITQNNRLAPLSLRLALPLGKSGFATDYDIRELPVAYSGNRKNKPPSWQCSILQI